MKRLLLLLLVVLSFGSLQAQTFYSDYSAMGDSAMASGGSGAFQVFNNIRAASGSVVLRWNVIGFSSNLAPTATANMWTFGGVCDNIACRPSVDVLNGTSYTTFSYGTTRADFHAVFTPDNAPANSTAWVRVQVKDTATGGTTRILTFIATKTPQGVTTTVRTEENIKVGPNPARESVNVFFDNDDIKTISVYNLLGQPVSVFHVTGNSANLPLGDAPSGVYFLRMYDIQGKIVATRRFTRQ